MALLCGAPTESTAFETSMLMSSAEFLSSSETAFKESNFQQYALLGSVAAPNYYQTPTINCSHIFPEKSAYFKPSFSPNGKLRVCAAVYGASTKASASTGHSNAETVLERPLLDESTLHTTDERLHSQEKPQQLSGSSSAMRKPESFDLRLDMELVHRTSQPESWSDGRLTPAKVKRYTDELEQTYRRSPAFSPKEMLGKKWREYQGSNNWEGLLDPLDANLRREIIKYGEFAQATYDAFDFDSHSKFCGSCRYNRHTMLDKVGLHNTGYKVTKYLYAMSDVHMPNVFGRSHSTDTWSRDSNWMGYVAVATDEKEVKRLGRRDIVVAWRGTVTQLEWMDSLRDILHPVCNEENPAVKVERGFLGLYTSKEENSRYNKKSASEQVMEEVRRVVEMYGDGEEELSITITGHSLGGALALLSAYEMAAKGVNGPDIPITVISFGAPRVGNSAFRDRLNEIGVKTLRVVNEQDMVPKMPGIFFNEGTQKYEKLLGPLIDVVPWYYTHVGAELRVDLRHSRYLKNNPDPAGCHNLEAYLHSVDGFLSSSVPFRAEAKRDVALINKTSDLLKKEVMIPSNWYQLQHKGLVRNRYGRWVQPEREAEDVPSPRT
eukprot:Gb_34047 [translate_table: standard]